MARLLAFTQSERFGGDDAVLIELLRAWPREDAWTVLLNPEHPGKDVYREALAGRAELVFPEPRLRALRAAIAAAGPDAVLVSSGGFPPTAPTLRALWAARWAGVRRAVLVAHNEPNLGAGPRALWRAARGRLAAALCAERVSVSRDCARKIAAACGRPVRAIHNGAGAFKTSEDPAALRRELGVPEDGPLIGAVGNLERRKGFRVLLEAFRLLAARRPDARLVVVGAGAEPEEEAALEALLEDPALAGRAKLAGYRPRAWRFAAAFDVCAVPSIERESFGLAALDAMRAGRPVAAARTGGLPELVADGETGLLVAPGDAAALAAALDALLADPARARAMGEAGRRRAEAFFSAARMAAEYREVLLPGGQMITSPS